MQLSSQKTPRVPLSGVKGKPGPSPSYWPSHGLTTAIALSPREGPDTQSPCMVSMVTGFGPQTSAFCPVSYPNPAPSLSSHTYWAATISHALGEALSSRTRDTVSAHRVYSSFHYPSHQPANIFHLLLVTTPSPAALPRACTGSDLRVLQPQSPKTSW